MPLMPGSLEYSTNIKADLDSTLSTTLKKLDQFIAAHAQLNKLARHQVRTLRPCNVCVLINEEAVFIVATNKNASGTPFHHHRDLKSRPMSLESAIQMAERDLAFEEAFGFTFPRGLLNATDSSGDYALLQVAEAYIKAEVLHLERLARIVRINPVFHGRDFMLDGNLVFVLAPFEEPFTTIYVDHIKPTVEKIEGLSCFKADDIYDNKPIINEAHIIISELTGRNPNVFYETGIAHTVGKEVILITQSMDDVPFDLRHLRCILYEYTPRGIQILETNLKNTIDNIRARTKK
jgi:hypothetical protein